MKCKGCGSTSGFSGGPDYDDDDEPTGTYTYTCDSCEREVTVDEKGNETTVEDD